MRPAVRAFALAMEQKLRDNDHKGGWSLCTTLYLMRRLRNEVEELAELVNAARRSHLVYAEHSEEMRMAILQEAADVANFAMMIADKYGTLAARKDEECKP